MVAIPFIPNFFLQSSYPNLIPDMSSANTPSGYNITATKNSSSAYKIFSNSDSIFQVPFVPMTANNLPIGYSATFNGASGAVAGYQAYGSFGGSVSYSDGAAGAWRRIELPFPTIFNKITVSSGGDYGARITNFTIQGSNNDSSWTNIYTFGDVTPSGGAWATYSFPNLSPYKYYRIYANAGAYAPYNIIGVKFEGYLQGWSTVSSTFIPGDYIQIDTIQGIQFSEYKITRAFGGSQGMPVDWTIQGSPDGIKWDVIDTVVGADWTANATKVSPIMTSNTAPAGYIASANNFLASYDPYKAFEGSNNDSSTCWFNNIPTFPCWLQLQFPATVVVNGYSVTSRNSTDFTRNPKNWQLQGSNDGVIWITLDIQVDQINWAGDQTRNYHFLNSLSYLYYRIFITANGMAIPDATTIGELTLYNETGNWEQVFKLDASYLSSRYLRMVITKVDAPASGHLNIPKLKI